SDEAGSFVQAAYDLGWVRSGFDWPTWSQTAEARNLQNDPHLLAQATQVQLASLLTVCIRQDRFVEGALMSAYESGLLVRILERAAAILADVEQKHNEPSPALPAVLQDSRFIALRNRERRGSRARCVLLTDGADA